MFEDIQIHNQSAIGKDVMTDLEKVMKDNQEFIDETREIVEKVNDMLFSLRSLMEKRGSHISHHGRSPNPKDAEFQRDLQQLLQRHFGTALSLMDLNLDRAVAQTATEQKVPSKLKKYRTLV